MAARGTTSRMSGERRAGHFVLARMQGHTASRVPSKSPGRHPGREGPSLQHRDQQGASVGVLHVVLKQNTRVAFRWLGICPPILLLYVFCLMCGIFSLLPSSTLLSSPLAFFSFSFLTCDLTFVYFPIGDFEQPS